jgi:hypothetical protein
MRKLTDHIEKLKTYDGVKKAIAWGCIFWGIFAFFTPFTPASWLFFVGLVSLLGKEEAERLTLKIIGEKYFKKFHLAKFFKD